MRKYFTIDLAKESLKERMKEIEWTNVLDALEDAVVYLENIDKDEQKQTSNAQRWKNYLEDLQQKTERDPTSITKNIEYWMRC